MSATRTAVLVVVSAVIGGAVGSWLTSATPPPASTAGADGIEGTADDLAGPTPPAEIAALARRVEQVERRVGTRGARRAAPQPDGSEPAVQPFRGGGDSVAAPWFDTSGDPVPGFVDAVRSAIGEIQRQNREVGAEKKRGDDRKRYLTEVDKRLRDYADPLQLTEAQLTSFKSAAETSIDARLAAQANGAKREELESLDREKERAFRDILGSARHREYRKLEIDRFARPFIADIASKAGVDGRQRDQIESLLSSHIDRLVDTDVRLKTEELDGSTRTTLRTSVNTANREAWDRLRNEILRDDQRDRVPARLR